MENLKIWIISICGAGIITSLFKMLISNSNLRKSVNIFLSMFVFLLTVLPIENIISDFEIKFDSDYEQVSYDEIYKNGYEAIIINSIEKICNYNNIKLLDIKIDSYIDENYFLVVNKIELELNSNQKNDVIKKQIYDELNFEVIFI